MNLDGFKSELINAQKRIIKIGFRFLLICGGISALILFFAGTTNRSAFILGCIFGSFGVIGLLMMITSILKNKKINSDEHELIKAIKNKNDKLVIWIYQSTMITEYKTAAHQHKSFYLILYKSDGKKFQFISKTEAQTQSLIEFLSSCFPNALVGYSEENRRLASEIVGKELK